MEGKIESQSRMLKREECVLVVIDEQERLMPVIAEKEKVLQNTCRILNLAAIAGIPVIVTEQEKLGQSLPEIVAAAIGAKTISKTSFGCFGSGEFYRIFKGLGRKALVLAGVEAHICVAQTALQALPSYKVHVVADAVSSRTLENKAAAVERMRQAGATISTTEMFIYEILQKAGTDEFKAALPLVK